MIKVGTPRIYIRCPNCDNMIYEGGAPYLCGYCGAKFYYVQDREPVFLEKPVSVLNCKVTIPEEAVIYDKDVAVKYAISRIAEDLANQIIQHTDLRTFDDFENHETFCKNVYEIHGKIRLVSPEYRFKEKEND